MQNLWPLLPLKSGLWPNIFDQNFFEGDDFHFVAKKSGLLAIFDQQKWAEKIYQK